MSCYRLDYQVMDRYVEQIVYEYYFWKTIDIDFDDLCVYL